MNNNAPNARNSTLTVRGRIDFVMRSSFAMKIKLGISNIKKLKYVHKKNVQRNTEYLITESTFLWRKVHDITVIYRDTPIVPWNLLNVFPDIVLSNGPCGQSLFHH